jgi:putative peptidoglycan lipid II flippase
LLLILPQNNLKSKKRSHVSPEGGVRIGRWAIGAATLVGATLLAGRVSGLFREIQLAASFGVSVSADVAVLLMTLPDLLVNLVLSGGLSAALIPRLSTLPLQSAQALSRQTLLLVSILFGFIACILVFVPNLWFSLLAPGLAASDMPSTAAIIMTAIAIPLAAVTGVTSASLNSQQKFLVAGCGTLIFNLIVITALACGQNASVDPLLILGIGIATGSALRLLSQLLTQPREWLWGPITTSALDSIFIRGFLVTAATASLLLLVPVVVRAFASTVSSGAIAALNYATKLVELPAGVLVTSLATVALVKLSAQYASGDRLAAKQTLQNSLKRALTNAVGAGALIAYFAGPLVELALGRGAMDATAIARVVGLTQLLMVGLPFLAISSIAMADLNAKMQPWVIFKVTFLCLFLLPILALPGILKQSEGLLVASIVGFQVVHALWLAIKCGLFSDNLMSWLDKGLFFSMLVIVCMTCAIIFIDRLLKPVFESQIFLHGLFAGCCITLLIASSQKVLMHNKPTESGN